MLNVLCVGRFVYGTFSLWNVLKYVKVKYIKIMLNVLCVGRFVYGTFSLWNVLNVGRLVVGVMGPFCCRTFRWKDISYGRRIKCDLYTQFKFHHASIEIVHLTVLEDKFIFPCVTSLYVRSTHILGHRMFTQIFQWAVARDFRNVVLSSFHESYTYRPIQTPDIYTGNSFQWSLLCFINGVFMLHIQHFAHHTAGSVCIYSISPSDGKQYFQRLS
jgi:hypothetical protein